MRSDGNFEWTVALQKGEAYQQCNTFMLHNRRWKHIKKGDTSPNQACKINMSINILFVNLFTKVCDNLKSYVGVLSYLDLSHLLRFHSMQPFATYALE